MNFNLKEEDQDIRVGNLSKDEILENLEEDKDLETQLLLEDYTFTRYYIREVDKFFSEHNDYFVNKMTEFQNRNNILPALTLKDPNLLTIEEKEMIPKIEKLLQMHKDGEEMEFKHEEILAIEDKKEPEVPYWIQRNPLLFKRYKELRAMLTEVNMEFSESIFFPEPREQVNEFQIQEELEKLEGRDMESIADDYDKEFMEKARIGEFQENQEEEYVKKSKVLGEVLNRISDQMVDEHKKKLEENVIPNEGDFTDQIEPN
jgi:hypothetical protein